MGPVNVPSRLRSVRPSPSEGIRDGLGGTASFTARASMVRVHPARGIADVVSPLFNGLPASYVPLTGLAAILFFLVAFNMGEWREGPELLRMTRTDVGVG